MLEPRGWDHAIHLLLVSPVFEADVPRRAGPHGVDRSVMVTGPHVQQPVFGNRRQADQPRRAGQFPQQFAVEVVRADLSPCRSSRFRCGVCFPRRTGWTSCCVLGARCATVSLPVFLSSATMKELFLVVVDDIESVLVEHRRGSRPPAAAHRKAVPFRAPRVCGRPCRSRTCRCCRNRHRPARRR